LAAAGLLLAAFSATREPAGLVHRPADRAPAPARAVAFAPVPQAPTAQPVPATAAPAKAATAPAVTLNVIAPPQLLVGETNELVVGVGPNGGIAEISFTLQFDADVLQVRAATDGSWTAGAQPRFVADIAGTEDRVQIRSAVVGRHVASGIVAIVEFQAVAPGHTRVLLSDVTVKDAAGRVVPFAVSASSLPVVVVSLPPPGP